jgi:biotin carboxyl carrier protein
MAKVTVGGRSYEVEVRGNTIVVDGHDFPIAQSTVDGVLTVTAGGIRYRVQLPAEEARVSGMEVEVDHRPFAVAWEGNLGGGAFHGSGRRSVAQGATIASVGAAAVKGGVAAQIAGRIVSVKVKVGDVVAGGDVLLLLEAMKMENEIKAPGAGTVSAVLVTEGQRVGEGETLVVIE